MSPVAAPQARNKATMGVDWHELRSGVTSELCQIGRSGGPTSGSCRNWCGVWTA